MGKENWNNGETMKSLFKGGRATGRLNGKGDLKKS